jgi:vancomycin resistance protein YoaR
MHASTENFRRRARNVVPALVFVSLAAACGGGPPASDDFKRPAAEQKSFSPSSPPPLREHDWPKPRLQVIAEFTTRYPCCQPRVTNIKRAVQILDGQRIAPGATFSLNEALGERTAERGFVPAPMISGGAFVESVGGGISQVATTLYNAAFFAGLDLVDHTPHSIYISRYPMGREATISWGGPELIFRNDWSAPIRIDARATNTSVRFRLFSLPLGRRIATKTAPAYSYVAPQTIYVQNRTLPPGTQRVRQSAGSAGFDVTYTRRVYEWSRLRSRERFHVRYQPQNAIIEVGP